ncbi:MAG: hypothetical protein V2A56_03095 [bacterium]
MFRIKETQWEITARLTALVMTQGEMPGFAGKVNMPETPAYKTDPPLSLPGLTRQSRREEFIHGQRTKILHFVQDDEHAAQSKQGGMARLRAPRGVAIAHRRPL